VVLLTEALVERTLVASRESPRRRALLPFHKDHDELLHRMFNALQPGTYVRPHRHLRSHKHEVFLLLRGALDFVIHSEDGQIESAHRLIAGSAQFGIDIPPSAYHSLIVRAPDTVVYEVKEGPYAALDDKDFASWAPAEGSPEVKAYMEQLEAALNSIA
jgi:cupin fold WbuC family metalloprotein